MRAEVYRCPIWKLWACLKYDDADNIIGEADWHHRKNQALFVADLWMRDNVVSEIRVFTADGTLQRIERRAKS